MGYTTVITTKGHEVLAKAVAGAALPFSRMVLSNSRGDDVTLGNETMTAVIDSAMQVGTKLKIEVEFINSSVLEGFHIHEIGIIVNDPDEGEILFSVSSTDSPDYMPAHTEHALEERIVLFMEVGAEDLVTTVDSTVFVTKSEISALKEWANGLFASVGHNHDLVYSPYVHGHDATYLGKTAKATDSDKLGGYQISQLVNALNLFTVSNYGAPIPVTTSTTVTAAYTNRAVHVNSTNNTVHTLPANTHAAGSQIPFTRLGTGEVTIAAGSGLSIRQAERQIKEQNDMVVAVFISTNDVLLVGPRK